jgi:ketosteroid isomerase-like protein
MPTPLEIADRLFAAITAGNVDEVRNLYASSCVIWHNSDGTEQTVDENLKVLGWVVRHLENRRYEEVRRQETPSGFVQQHVLRGTTTGGVPIEIPACIVVRVEGGRITRLDEYIDSAHVLPLLKK